MSHTAKENKISLDSSLLIYQSLFNTVRFISEQPAIARGLRACPTVQACGARQEPVLDRDDANLQPHRASVALLVGHLLGQLSRKADASARREDGHLPGTVDRHAELLHGTGGERDAPLQADCFAADALLVANTGVDAQGEVERPGDAGVESGRAVHDD